MSGNEMPGLSPLTFLPNPHADDTIGNTTTDPLSGNGTQEPFMQTVDDLIARAYRA
jgi:hypothetical protein